MRTSRRWPALIVSGVISVRVASAALFFYTFVNGLKAWAICLFLFGCFTDALDGHLARKLRASLTFGAYFDPTADFLLALASFSAFAIKGIYPFWTLFLICSMFSQFILTSGLRRPLYDPVGKYYGLFLFAAIGITLLFPRSAVCYAVLVALLGFTVLSLLSRSLFFLARSKESCGSAFRLPAKPGKNTTCQTPGGQAVSPLHSEKRTTKGQGYLEGRSPLQPPARSCLNHPGTVQLKLNWKRSKDRNRR